MELKDLVGLHDLSGVQTINMPISNKYETQDSQCFSFVLDGSTFTAIEDPSDGYRSSMRELTVFGFSVANRFDPVKVLCVHRDRSGYDAANILEMYDVRNGKLVLEVGTSHTDDYYPSFVSNWNPENLADNEEAT